MIKWVILAGLGITAVVVIAKKAQQPRMSDTQGAFRRSFQSSRGNEIRVPTQVATLKIQPSWGATPW